MTIRLYPFLLSSLPWLRLGAKPFYSSAQFLDLCRPYVEPAELAALEHAQLLPHDTPQSDVERHWYGFEVYLRNRIAVARGVRLHVDARPWLRPEIEVYPGLSRSLDEAFTAPTPLAREKALDTLRWQRLEDLQAQYPFAFGALVAYRLKLLLAEKWANQDAARSDEALGGVIAAAVQQAGTVRS